MEAKTLERKRQIRFWDYNINPITGWVERNREEMYRLQEQEYLRKERKKVAFQKLANKEGRI